MPQRAILLKELADLLGTLAHPHRLRIVQELHGGERDVNSLQAALGVSHSGASQHLAVLRAHRLVAERREGRRVFYRLRHPDLAPWLLGGATFLEPPAADSEAMRAAIDAVRGQYTGLPGDSSNGASNGGRRRPVRTA